MQDRPSAPGLDLRRKTGALVLPGDVVAALVDTRVADSVSADAKRATVRLGSGVRQEDATLLSTKAGFLKLDKRRNKVWVENNQKRYVPALEDMVIGVVIERHSEDYRLDINGSDTATLPALAFEGATKKNKPNLAIGALVYCRITRASKNMEAEASCVEPGSNKSWVGGEALYGELKGGNVVSVSLGLARALLAARGPVLGMLGEKISFESAVGVNGRVWLSAQSVENTVVLSVAIAKADVMEREQWLTFVRKMLEQAG